MIRALTPNDLDAVMQIWLDTNLQAHDFIPKAYWTDHYEMVKQILPQAEVYMYENDATKQINGFIGLSEDYIEGIFVRAGAQSQGIGKQLLDYAKSVRSTLRLSVYQKNTRAIRFYQGEQFVIESESTDADTNQKEYVMIWENVVPTDEEAQI